MLLPGHHKLKTLHLREAVENFARGTGCRNIPRTLTASPTRPSHPTNRGEGLPHLQGSRLTADRSPVPKRTSAYSRENTVTTTSPVSPDGSTSPVSGSHTWTTASSGR